MKGHKRLVFLFFEDLGQVMIPTFWGGRNGPATQSRAFFTAKKCSRLTRGHFSRLKNALDSLAGISHG